VVAVLVLVAALYIYIKVRKPKEEIVSGKKNQLSDPTKFN